MLNLPYPKTSAVASILENVKLPDFETAKNQAQQTLFIYEKMTTRPRKQLPAVAGLPSLYGVGSFCKINKNFSNGQIWEGFGAGAEEEGGHLGGAPAGGDQGEGVAVGDTELFLQLGGGEGIVAGQDVETGAFQGF